MADGDPSVDASGNPLTDDSGNPLPCPCGCGEFYRLYKCSNNAATDYTLTAEEVGTHAAETYHRREDGGCYYLTAYGSELTPAGDGKWSPSCSDCRDCFACTDSPAPSYYRVTITGLDIASCDACLGGGGVVTHNFALDGLSFDVPWGEIPGQGTANVCPYELLIENFGTVDVAGVGGTFTHPVDLIISIHLGPGGDGINMYIHGQSDHLSDFFTGAYFPLPFDCSEELVIDNLNGLCTGTPDCHRGGTGGTATLTPMYV